MVILVLMLVLAAAFPAVGADGALTPNERTALELLSEFHRLGSSDDPSDREDILRRIIAQSPQTEEAEAAHWRLCDLYLDGFDTPREKDARDVLVRFLRNYPRSRWTTQVRCRLLGLCEDRKEAAQMATQLRRELANDSSLPQMLRVGGR